MRSPSKAVEKVLLVGNATKASSSKSSDGNHAETHAQMAKVDQDAIPGKRKLDEVDMRPHKKSLLATSLGEVVTLIVGDESKDSRFIVHKDILCAASPFFEAACKPEWQGMQGKEKDIIRLPEEDPEVFRAFLHWVYLDDDICLPLKDFAKDPIDQPEGLLVKLYVLGDKYQMPRLRNRAIDALTCGSLQGDFGYALEVLDYACKNTAQGSALRRYLADTAIEHWLRNDEGLDELDGKVYPELFHDVAISLMKDRRDRRDKDDSSDGGETSGRSMDMERSRLLASISFCEEYHTHEANYYRGFCEKKSWMTYGW